MLVQRSSGLLAPLFAAALLSACGTSLNRAPVEDRMPGQRPASAPTPAAPATPATGAVPADSKPLPGAENAGKPGYYTVKPGDNLTVISKIHGRSVDDIQRWNNFIVDKNRIETGWVLRILPPGVEPAAPASASATSAAAPVASTPSGAGRPLDAKPPAPASAPVAQAGSAPSSAPAAVASKDDDGMNWAWPAANGVTGAFDEVRNKGLDFAGKPGDAVFAAADGRVIHAGAGLRGYGNLVIIKHNDTYLTAYAHNQTLLVKDDQVVRRGQKIAEMGNTESDTVKLHFELRKQGKPVDPAKVLPLR